MKKTILRVPDTTEAKHVAVAAAVAVWLGGGGHLHHLTVSSPSPLIGRLVRSYLFSQVGYWAANKVFNASSVSCTHNSSNQSCAKKEERYKDVKQEEQQQMERKHGEVRDDRSATDSSQSGHLCVMYIKWATAADMATTLKSIKTKQNKTKNRLCWKASDLYAYKCEREGKKRNL